jgi:hypothetical protein
MDAFFRLGLSCVFAHTDIVSVDDSDDDFVNEVMEMPSKLNRGRMNHGYPLHLSSIISVFSVSAPILASSQPPTSVYYLFFSKGFTSCEEAFSFASFRSCDSSDDGFCLCLSFILLNGVC